MTIGRVSRAALIAAFVVVPCTAAAQQFGPEPDARTRTELLALRETAWRTWFANDRAGFQRVVPEELVAMGWDGGAWEDRAAALGAMGEFAKTGQKLVTLSFPRTVMQQYGDVVIFYTTFHLVLQGATRPETLSGRGTEIFVRRGGRWIHTGWHLDRVAEYIRSGKRAGNSSER